MSNNEKQLIELSKDLSYFKDEYLGAIIYNFDDFEVMIYAKNGKYVISENGIKVNMTLQDYFKLKFR